MISLLSSKISYFCIKNDIVDEDYKEMFEYSLQTRLEEIITLTFIIFLIGSLTSVVNTIAFIVVFIFLRKRSGGYHCKSSLNCFIISNLVTLLNLKLAVIMYGLEIKSWYIIYGFAIICLLIIGPINHPNLSMSELECKANKNSLIVRLVILTISIILFLGFNKMLAIICILSTVSVSISVIVSKLVGQEVK